MAVCATAQANEKKYIKIGSKQFLRCQPVPGYSGSAALGGTTGSANEWWIIRMSPAAAWNSPRCVASGDGFNPVPKPVNSATLGGFSRDLVADLWF